MKDRRRSLRLPAQMADMSPGTKLSRYRIVSKIGAGGMGEVYLAQDTKLDRKVALKILPDGIAFEGERMRRFVQEAKAASALNHPNIITIYEISETDNKHFIAAEYIDGHTVHSLLSDGPMSLSAVLDAGVQIASALQAAHKANIIHRDIKPDNVMVRPDGLVKLLDFGIAKVSEPAMALGTHFESAATTIKGGTSPGFVIGTAAYMSPEQAKGLLVDARTDVFSFGVLLYEMLTGRKPFKGETAIDLIGAILHKEPVPIRQLVPDLPSEVERIVNKLLRKDCNERYQTIKDVQIDLKDVRKELEFQDKLKVVSGGQNQLGEVERNFSCESANKFERGIPGWRNQETQVRRRGSYGFAGGGGRSLLFSCCLSFLELSRQFADCFDRCAAISEQEC